MHLRPARLLAVGGAFALTTVLSSCGFNYATDKIYTPAAGANDRAASVDVLGAVVVSGQEGAGTFIASFADNLAENEDLEPKTVESIAGAGDDAELEFDAFEPIEIPPGELVNLESDGIVVRGELGPGDFVTLTIGFGNGESVEVDVPVVPPCDEFEGLDTAAEGSGETFDCEVEAPTGSEH